MSGSWKAQRLDYSSLLHLLRHAMAIGTVSLTFDSSDVQDTLAQQGVLSLEQKVFHPESGFADVVGIDGDLITIRDEKDSAVTRQVKALDFLTQGQAEAGFGANWHAGGAKTWRRRQAKWSWLNKQFCTRKGDYKRFLDKYQLNRGSMDLLILNFENEVKRAAQKPILLENSKIDPISAPNPAIPVIAIATAYDPQVHERTDDPANVERQNNIEIEIEKHLTVVPTHHQTILFFQRRNLDPQTVALYHKIEDTDKKRVAGMRDRKIDELIAEVVALAPAVLPDVLIATTTASVTATNCASGDRSFCCAERSYSGQCHD